MASAKITVLFICGFLAQCLIKSEANQLANCGCPAPSVTIPNIIAALLPPSNKAAESQPRASPAPITAKPCISAPVPSPISFVPVPQPVPIKVAAAQAPSVTIPNIILALLPPSNKAPAPVTTPAPVTCPAPATPQPIVIPIPQPYPVTVPDCDCCC